MFITNKRIDIPATIEVLVNGTLIGLKVVQEFKLLGVNLDSKLQMHTYVKDLTKMVNKKLYSIKKLFYLNIDIKLQFFKSFILPHFDYCSSLVTYLNYTSVSKLSRLYHSVIDKLLRLDVSHLSHLGMCTRLERYGLMSFQCRLF
jgi:hypothetical protein